MASGNEYDQRRQVVGQGLAARKLDAVLVAYSANLRYLSGFTGSSGSLLLLPDRAILFTDPRYQIQAPQEVNCQVKIAKGPLVASIAASISRLRLRRIGYEPPRMTCDWFESLRKNAPSHASLEPVTGWIEELRTIKSPDELDRIRRSVETNSRAFEQVSKGVRAGMTEQDLAAELEYRMRRLGAQRPAFETIVAGGERGALPHAQPTPAKLENGGLVVVDMGAVQDGYCSDVTCMLFVGSPDRKSSGLTAPCSKRRQQRSKRSGRVFRRPMWIARRERCSRATAWTRRLCIPRATVWASKFTNRRVSANATRHGSTPEWRSP